MGQSQVMPVGKQEYDQEKLEYYQERNQEGFYQKVHYGHLTEVLHVAFKTAIASFNELAVPPRPAWFCRKSMPWQVGSIRTAAGHLQKFVEDEVNRL